MSEREPWRETTQWVVPGEDEHLLDGVNLEDLETLEELKRIGYIVQYIKHNPKKSRVIIRLDEVIVKF